MKEAQRESIIEKIPWQQILGSSGSYVQSSLLAWTVPANSFRSNRHGTDTFGASGQPFLVARRPVVPMGKSMAGELHDMNAAIGVLRCVHRTVLVAFSWDTTYTIIRERKVINGAQVECHLFEGVGICDCGTPQHHLVID